MACKACAYWVLLPGQAEDGKGQKHEIGECHRMPPKVTDWRMDNTKREWAVTSERDWCGEFLDREDARRFASQIVEKGDA